MSCEMWKTFSWHCPNCGKISTGLRNEAGVIKVKCGRCHKVTVLTPMGRRHDRLDVYSLEDREEENSVAELPFF